jgi:hypothetical protein
MKEGYIYSKFTYQTQSELTFVLVDDELIV